METIKSVEEYIRLNPNTGSTYNPKLVIVDKSEEYKVNQKLIKKLRETWETYPKRDIL